MPDPHLHALVLAGGIGSRFWPASTPSRPKQLLPLAGQRPLVTEAVGRALALAPPERVRILTVAHLVDRMREALPASVHGSFLIEPRARGTAPVLAWAAWQLAREDPEALLVSLHSDHLVDPPSEFIRTLEAARRLAREADVLVTVGARPDRPETGFGYIRPGAPVGPASETDDAEPFRVDAFIEKPDEARARRYVEEGYLWNTGIFAWTARRFLEEVRAHAPEIAAHLPLLESEGAEGYFEAVPPISVDEAVLERSGRVACVRASFRWDDVGSWEALSRTRAADERGNVSLGEVHAVDSARNVVFAAGGPVVLFGVEDLVVVRTDGVTLVADRSRSRDLKELLGRLPEALRDLEEGP